MPAWLAPLLSTLGTTLISMLASLLTEKFLKKAAIVALEKIAASTETDVDNKLLEAAVEAWKEPTK